MNRRTLAGLTVAVAATALGRDAQAQALPPTPDNLDHELPSPRQSPGVGADLPELPLPQPVGISNRLFPGYRAEDVKTEGATIHVLSKGSGPPLLLIDGHPETHVTWHEVAPSLADTYTVVVPDLRGYGDSSKPDYSPDSRGYSFRVMAQDMVSVMATTVIQNSWSPGMTAASASRIV